MSGLVPGKMSTSPPKLQVEQRKVVTEEACGLTWSIVHEEVCYLNTVSETPSLRAGPVSRKPLLDTSLSASVPLSSISRVRDPGALPIILSKRTCEMDGQLGDQDPEADIAVDLGKDLDAIKYSLVGHPWHMKLKRSDPVATRRVQVRPCYYL